MSKPKSVRLQMILNPAIDHIRMATIHLVDRCLSKDYSRGKLAMKGTFSISDLDLRFFFRSSRTPNRYFKKIKSQTKWSEGPASVR